MFTSADQFFSGLASADLALKANIMGCPVEEEQCYNLVDQPSCEPCGLGGRCDCHWSYYDQMNPDSGGYCEDNDPGDSQSICPTEEVRLWHQMLSATPLPQSIVEEHCCIECDAHRCVVRGTETPLMLHR